MKTNDRQLIALVAAALKDTEPKQLPVEEMEMEHKNRLGQVFARHRGWKCPYCGKYCRRHDRTFYDHKLKMMRTEIDLGGYNAHFGKAHATPDWKARHILAVIHKAERLIDTETSATE